MPSDPTEEVFDEAISLNALSDTVTSTTIKFKGVYRKKVLIILADSGSTNSFIASDTAKQLGFLIQVDVLMRVVAANEGYLMGHQFCP